MTEPKVRLIARYDEIGCHSIEAHLNTDGVSREDVAELIHALFYPGALPVPRNSTAMTHTEIGRTETIPRIVETVTAVSGSRTHFAH